jgi:hypothetical protein
MLKTANAMLMYFYVQSKQGPKIKLVELNRYSGAELFSGPRSVEGVVVLAKNLKVFVVVVCVCV